MAKVLKQDGKAELVHLGLPTDIDDPKWTDEGVAIQVLHAKVPSRRVVEGATRADFQRGIGIHGARRLKFNMDNVHEARRQFISVAEEVTNSTSHGDRVLRHCMAGVHRAAVAASLLRALFLW